MSLYPEALDDDSTIIRVDDNITELGSEAINQLRSAVFAIEQDLGLGLSGSVGDLATRLNVSLNANGTIKQSALAAVGLVTLPITNVMIGTDAGIAEYKLSLDHTTSDLYTMITSNKSLLDSVNVFLSITNSDLLSHISGATILSDGSTAGRHVASQIDLNSVSSDSRDPTFSWVGLKDKTGNLRSATQVAEALLQINNDLTAHENSINQSHHASAITVDTDNFHEIPVEATDVQKVIDYLDRAEELNIGEHRAVQHSNGIPFTARSQSISGPDGYGIDNVVPLTRVNAYLVNPPANYPVDSNVSGDNLIKFQSSNANYVFDSYFSQVKVGDIIRVNYGNGLEGIFEIDSTRFIPGIEWTVRINGINLANAVDGNIDGYDGYSFDGYDGYAYARIDRPQCDYNTYGVLALAASNPTPSSLYSTIPGSVIVGSPRGATALGIGFDGNKLTSAHYKLWLQLFPTGNPSDKVISLPYIDVTGDAGATPGSYTLDKVVQETNKAFRKIGYNYRFIAFQHKGNFGIMLADAANNASFAIINGSNSTGTLTTSTYLHNVVGDSSDGWDALGFGEEASVLASPAYQSTFTDSTAAQLPTRVISPAKRRFAIANGQKIDDFAAGYLTTNGYWNAEITGKVNTGSSLEVTYRINLNLKASKLAPGKTLVVQPTVEVDDPLYLSSDYGRFIIKDVHFTEPCGDEGAYTTISVINGVHGTADALGTTSATGRNVRIFFGEDSVGFNDSNIIDSSATIINYHRYHEIYLTKEGKTFAHERARMVCDQAETSSLLRSEYWHISYVSPKLRGYRDGTTTFNKYVRFYITRYDSTSGEFDGYIGQRYPSSSGILSPGPLTTSRKNVTTRFYDETYTDYIELQFKELNPGPSGIPILSDSNDRYIDIEIFPTLRWDDENLLIGSCEVNWSPTSNQNIIEYVKDLRQFGSIGSNDLNNDALELIRSGDRYLHENGIIRGLGYVPKGTTTTGQIWFDGGLALVNGKIVYVNNSSVTIPAVSDNGTTPSNVTWAVCVNEDGNLIPLMLTADKDQVFVGSGGLYYLPSATFDELVNTRKDLTPIALIEAHIASITIADSDVLDVRRYVVAEGSFHPLTLTSKSYIGNFYSFTSLINWINSSAIVDFKVVLKGEIDVDSTVDLTTIGSNKYVSFEGDGATINVSSAKGFKLKDNISFRNIKFNYNPTGVTYTALDDVNSGNGCLYSKPTSLKNITIDKCRFASTIAGQRPPFIGFELDTGRIIDGLIITNNKFSDVATAYKQAAISIIGTQAGGLGDPAILANCVISGNTCNRSQSIVITSVVTVTYIAPTYYVEWNSPGLNTINTIIEKNNCGLIGYCVSSKAHSSISSIVDGYTVSPGLAIRNNTVSIIGLVGNYGSLLLAGAVSIIHHGTGNVVIESNSAHWIHPGVANGTHQFASLVISNNNLTAYGSGYLLNYLATTNAAIYVIGNSTTSVNPSVKIVNNSIKYGYYDSTAYYYDSGIIAVCDADILNNTLSDCSIYGIALWPLGSGWTTPGAPNISANNTYHVTGNCIFRKTTGMTAYVANLGSANITKSNAIITDNFFSNPYIDLAATDTNTILSAPDSWIVERNKNQTVTAEFMSFEGTVAIGASGASYYGGQDVFNSSKTNTVVLCRNETNNIATSTNRTLRVDYDNADNGVSVSWAIPLFGRIPNGAYLISVSTSVYLTATPGTLKEAQLLILNNSVAREGTTITLASGDQDISVDPIGAGKAFYVQPGSSTFIKFILTLQHSSTLEAHVERISLDYRW